MALASALVVEVNSGGSDSNGGGFVTGSSGTDWSQQTSVKYALTSVTTSAANAILLNSSASADMVGNLAQITSGTNFLTGFYQILSVSAGVSITLDRTCTSAAGSGGVVNIGGALATPGKACSMTLVAGNIIFIKNTGTNYSITSASTNVSNGCMAINIAGVNAMYIQGYLTNRVLGNSDSPPSIQLNVASATLFSGGTNAFIQNLVFDGNSQTSSRLTTLSAYFIRCLIENFNTNNGGSAIFIYCLATGNSANIFTFGSIYCEATGNTATPFNVTQNGGFTQDCLAYNNTGGTTDGFNLSGIPVRAINCTSYGNGREGFFAAASVSTLLMNCYAEANADFGIRLSGNGQTLINCCAFGNTAGDYSTSGVFSEVGRISVTSSALSNPGSGDFSLNNTSGAGALLRAGGFPSNFPAGTTHNYPDVGSVQHQDSGGGSSVFSVEVNNHAIVQRVGVSSY